MRRRKEGMRIEETGAMIRRMEAEIDLGQGRKGGTDTIRERGMRK